MHLGPRPLFARPRLAAKRSYRAGETPAKKALENQRAALHAGDRWNRQVGSASSAETCISSWPDQPVWADGLD